MKIAIIFSRASLMRVIVSLILLLIGAPALQAANRPLKVFILAGQSNMEGHAKIETFEYIGDDPATAPLLKQMRGADGKPTVCDHVWISYYTGMGESNAEGFGKLTAGYGSRQKPGEDGGKIGPEFTFGLTLDEKLKEPCLIIKTAWGGKSLHTDFRPPSAGPYLLSDWQKENYPKQEGHGLPKDFEKWKAEKVKETGVYYRLMIEQVKRVLTDLKRVCPAYDPAAGYEIAGFVWLQGWNDMVDGHVYPPPKKGDATPRFASYSDCLAHFIRDVRRDLAAPKMPFVIGVMGVGGAKAGSDIVAFREAMAVPASLPEFKGNVVAVQTAPFWSEELGAIDDKHGKVRQMGYYLDSKHKDHANADGSMTSEQKREYLKKFEADLITPTEVALWNRGASNAGYHYLGCAKTFALMGQAFAEANLAMINPPKEQVAAEPRHGEMAGYLLVPNEKVLETFNAGFSMYIAAWPLLKQYPGQRFQSGLPGTWMFAQPVDKPLEKGYSDIEGGLGWWRDTEYATETPKFIMGGVAPDFVEWANGPGAGKGRDWAKPNARFAGHLLDTRPSNPNRALQMETQHIPSVQATDSKGVSYARISPTQFPSDVQGDSALVHCITSYSKQALWDAVQAWFDGGPVASGAVNPDGAALHEFPGRGEATWQIYPDGTAREEKVPVAWNSFATPFAPDRNTFGYKWNSQCVGRDDSTDRHLVVLPEFFRLGQNDKQKPVWSPVPASEIPAETGLADVRFDWKRSGPPETYETPSDADSCWKKPGPKAGPFKANLGDGSVAFGCP